jgi:hypothetical protein
MLAEHWRDIHRYLAPAKALVMSASSACAAEEGGRSSAGQGAAAELRRTLGALRETLATGLEARRDKLDSAAWYQQWRARAGLTPGGPPPPASLARHATGGLSDGISSSSSTSSSTSSSGIGGAESPIPDSKGARQAAAFYSAVDAALLGVRC